MDTKIKKAFFILIFVLFIDILLYIFQPLGDNFYIISDFMIVIYALAAIIMGFYAFKLHGIKSVQGRALLLLVCGMIFWMLGEFFWSFYEVFLQMEVPFPSIADIFWYLGYPFFGLGLYHIWKITKTPITEAKSYIVSFVILIAIAIVGFYGFYPNLVDTNLTSLGRIISLGYVFFGLILLIGEISILSFLFGYKLGRPWIVIMIAGIISILADVMYAQIATLYTSSSFFGILWDMDYILMAFGFYYYARTMKKLQKSVQ